MFYRGSDLFGFFGAKLGNGGSTITGAYPIVLADAGCLLVQASGNNTATIPANASIAIPTWTEILLLNLSASAFLIAITTDTLTLVNSTTTGTRTLAQNGMGGLIKVGTTSWIAWGAGMS